MKKNCTLCKKEINDMAVSVRLKISTVRKTSAETWEEIANMNLTSGEILCKECFDKFSITLSEAMLGEKSV